MDTAELKKIVAKHYDYASHGTGQYLHGDWFVPKHQDSLEYLLEEVAGESYGQLQDRVKELEAEVREGNEEMEKLEKQVSDLEEELAEKEAA